MSACVKCKGLVLAATETEQAAGEAARAGPLSAQLPVSGAMGEPSRHSLSISEIAAFDPTPLHRLGVLLELVSLGDCALMCAQACMCVCVCSQKLRSL